MGLLLMERFFFIARVPFSDLIVDTWVQNIPDSMTKTQSYFSHLGKPRTGVLPDIKLLTSKMRRNHRPEDITVYPLQEDGRPDMPLEALREIPSYSVPPRSTLGLLWVDLIHTIEFRDDAVEDIRMRGLEEPDNVEDFLALGYDVEQIEAVHLSGFSTRIEKVKVGNVYDAIVEEKPNICSPDSPWLIEIYSLSHNDDLHELESEARLIDLKKALLDVEDLRAGQKIDMIRKQFPTEFARISLTSAYKNAKKGVQKVRVLCRQSEDIELAERQFKLPVAEFFLYEELVINGLISTLRFPHC